MRINPKYNNTCAMRIGMYREGQCTDGPRPCKFLDECDWHYDEKTGEWDYPDTLAPTIEKKSVKRGRYGCGDNHHAGVSSIGRSEYQRRYWLVKKGLACWMPIRTNLNQALAEAGL